MLKLSALVTALVVAASGPAAAQSPESPVQDGAPSNVRGLSVGVLGGEVYTAGVHWTHVASSGLGFDGALLTFPQTFQYGAVVVMLPVGPLFAIPFGNADLMLRAGVSPLLGVGDGGSAGTITGYYGASLFVGRTGSLGLRVDWTRHRPFESYADGASLIEVGFAKATR
jgi:hypothetical protein